jgi:hypothetical protein
MYPLGDSSAHCFGTAGKQFMELWKKQKRKGKEGRKWQRKKFGNGKLKKQVTHFDQLKDDPSRAKSES